MEGSGRQGYLRELFDHSFEDLGVNMSLVASRVPAKEIVVAATFNVPHVDSFTSLDGDWEGSIILADSGVVQVNEVLIGTGSKSSVGLR